MNAAPRTPPSTMDPVTPKHCSPQLRHRILSQARYFSGLSAEDLEQVNRHFRELHYPAESIICHEGGNAERLFFVARGKVKLLRHSSGGDDVLLDLLPQGALFGGLAPLGTRHYPETAMAQTDTCVLAISDGDFQRLLEQHPQVTLAVLASVARSLDDAREVIRQISTSDVRTRVATALLKLAERLGDADEQGILIRAPLSRQDLAAMVGATPETVSRVMADLKREGLIDTGRQWVRVLASEALRAIDA